MWVQPLSFILVGCLVFASVRGFLLQFMKVRAPLAPTRPRLSLGGLLAALCGVVVVGVQQLGGAAAGASDGHVRAACTAPGCVPLVHDDVWVLWGNRYFTSYVMLMRMNLPPKYRTVITEVVGGDVQFNFFHRWFDVIFVVSALVSIAVLVVLAKTKTSATRTKLHYGNLHKVP